jgi:DNA invertase Pin-like site-specific DNA recombinase
MKGHVEKFTRKKEQAIIALLTAPTITDAAKSCGIGETTLWRWLQNATFAERYRQARKRALNVAINRLHRIVSDAVTTLQVVANDTNAPASSRVAAARVILETVLKAEELGEFEQRLEALEQAMLREKPFRR